MFNKTDATEIIIKISKEIMFKLYDSFFILLLNVLYLIYVNFTILKTIYFLTYNFEMKSNISKCYVISLFTMIILLTIISFSYRNLLKILIIFKIMRIFF